MVKPSLLPAMCLAVSCGACASSGAIPHPFPTPAGTDETHQSSTVSRFESRALVDAALGLVGTPYRNGGVGPGSFDCSGFTQYVFGRVGVSLPRAVREQFESGQPIDRAHVAPGDLVFFTTIAPGASHVAIAVGNDQFVHAPSSAGAVRVERIDAPYWSRRFVGIRRIIAR